jgi:CheY-like chemotaxis protein
VYGIVKQSRGDIGVYSEPGIGTTFKIYLPAVNKSATSPSLANSETLTKGEGTILLVEDEAPLRALTAEMLRRLGYTVLQAANGLEAIAVSDAHVGGIDILITDIVMPRMGGPELVEQLRQKRNNVRVIFMSGYTEAAALENLKLGADAVLLTKPFSTEMLARRVSEFRKPASKAAAAN